MKKYLYIFPIIISSIVFPFLALAQTYDASDTITLPPGLIDGIWSQATLVFNSLSAYTGMIIGVLLAIVVIESIIIMLRKPNAG
jgi:hypothetical protein